LDNIGIAFDSMTVNPANFAHTRLMLPALKKLFPRVVEELGEKKRVFSNPKVQQAVWESLEN
jgi:hypothetical protein